MREEYLKKLGEIRSGKFIKVKNLKDFGERYGI